MAIFNSYVKLPEGSWCYKPTHGYFCLRVGRSIFFARFEARASRSQRNVRSWWVFHATKTWHLWSIDGQLDSCRTLRVTCAGMIPKFQCSVSGVLFSRHNTYLLGNTLAVNWLVIWTHWLDPGHCFLIWGWVTTYYCHHIWGIIIH